MKKERAIIFKEVWKDEFTLKSLVDLIYQVNDTDIIIDCAKEAHLYTPGSWEHIPSMDHVANIKNRSNNLVHLILGNYSTYSIDKNPSDILAIHRGDHKPIHVPRFEEAVRAGVIDQVHCWPSYFLCWNGYKILKGFKNSRPNPDPEKEKLFFLPIRQAKPHRMLLLDELERLELLDNDISSYTCLDPNGVGGENLTRVDGQYYRGGKKVLVPAGDEPDLDLYGTPPNVLKKCLINVVSETSYDSHFFTEKTVWPLLYQMLFVIQGAQGINKKLTTLGFELYDEIIDYSFDNVESPRARTVALAEELRRLADLNLNYSEVWENMKAKREHNLCRLIDLYHNDEYMPGFVRNASNRLVEATHDPDNTAELIDPICGSWHCYVDANGRNQKAVDIIRDKPYFLDLYKNWL